MYQDPSATPPLAYLTDVEEVYSKAQPISCDVSKQNDMHPVRYQKV